MPDPRIVWRDNLLRKYEERIRNLEAILRMAKPWTVAHPELPKMIQEVLDAKLPKG